MLVLDDISVRIAGRLLLDGASARIPDGARVGLVGRNGIGKTTLTARLAEELAPGFEVLYWRSLRDAPLPAQWLGDAIRVVSGQQVSPPESEGARVVVLMDLLREHRSLLVLDNLETVFQPGRREPLLLEHSTPELQLLQRVRDEAHRFALAHHRTRRDKAMTSSLLDELPGVGPARKRALLAHFGSPEAVVAASREELQAVPGLPAKVARELHGRLHRAG